MMFMSLADFMKRGVEGDGQDERKEKAVVGEQGGQEERKAGELEVRDEGSKEGDDKRYVKPSGMSQEDYDAALAIFSPQRIQELYRNFDPAGVDPFYQRLYKGVRREAEEPDQRQINAARNLAGIGDALSLIIQTIGAAKGGLVDRRGALASERTEAGIERLKETYKRERDAYDAGLLGAMGKDVEGARGDYMKDRAALLAYLAALRKGKAATDWQNRKFEGEMLYKYDKLRSDEAARRDKLRSDEAGKKDKLALEREKMREKAGGGGNLKYLDFYNPVSGVSYRVEQNKWKANYTQIYNRIKKELYRSYPVLQRLENFGELKPEQKEEYVKQYMYDNPAALKFLDDIADRKYKDGEPEAEVQLPELTEVQYRAIEEIARTNRRDVTGAKRKIVEFLKAQGFDRGQVEILMKELEAE